MATHTFGVVLLALSDPTRRSILHRLATGPARVGEIAAPYPMSLNAVSKHLRYSNALGCSDTRGVVVTMF
jgi:DNA-binding transcriptional ArsR family regulator